jgi:hypothetical protein
MPTLEERMTYLEGRSEEHAGGIAEMRLDVRDLRGDLRDLRAEMNRRFGHFDAKLGWLIGFQFTTLMATSAALLNGYFR